MISRQVTKTKKDDDGDILALCNSSKVWSPRKKEDAISDINNGRYRYYVVVNDKEVNIHVVPDPDGEYLRTDKDKTILNNLDSLPDC